VHICIIYLHVCNKPSFGRNITTWVGMTQSPSSHKNNALSHKVVSASMCACVYVCECECVRVCVRVFVSIFLCVCRKQVSHQCLRVCVFVFVFVFTCVCMRVHACMHAF